ncbi:MAG: LysE family translocator [Phenylobacterium sp.]|uniref:LysE family translocator n=1 Tax=Phenylobacterium sp. TaxID=1871053 RepID=UPI00272519DB|nr:LysE family translocator [Phenylobacterium sp.]MDO8411853.1 LysE family translocator [Phenylobacterium sp.]
MALALILQFLLAATLIELTPGPNMGYLALVSARRGLGAGLLTVVGVTLGLAAHLIAAAVGLSQLAASQPALYQALRWAGVAYLLWLAFDAWRSRGAPSEMDQASQGGWRDIRRGFLTNLLNPKALIFYLTVIPSFIPAGAGNGPGAFLALGVLHLAVSVAVHLGLVALGARAYGWVAQAGRAPKVQGAFAMGLVAVAAWVAWSTRDA